MLQYTLQVLTAADTTTLTTGARPRRKEQAALAAAGRARAEDSGHNLQQYVRVRFSLLQIHWIDLDFPQILVLLYCMADNAVARA